MSNRIARLCGVAVCVAAVLVASIPSTSGAAGSKQLRRVKGNVGYQPVNVAAVSPVFGKIDLPDDATAVTEANSVAEIALPDSSIVTIGAGTHVKVGAFNETSDGPGSTIVVDGGTLRFDIKRPVGGHANYQFQTATSQIAVRGTIGLLSVINGITTVGCVQCAADSVVVTTGGQTFALATGQILTVTAAGAAIPGALTPATSAAFGSSGVGTGAGAGAAGAGAGGAVGGAVAGAVAAGAIAASISRPTTQPSTQPTVQPTSGPTPTSVPVNPTPTPSPTPSVKPTGTPTPSPSATPTSNGSVNISGTRRGAAAAPGATAPVAATPAAAAPIAAPPGGAESPIHGGRH